MKEIDKPQYEKRIKTELYHDHFENAKRYNIPRAQLIIADIPYNLGKNAYASNPSWYVDGDNANGESKKAGKSFFKTDEHFNIRNFFDFCARLLKPEPKETGRAPCMIIFCAFEQMHDVIELAKEYGFKGAQPRFFIKNYSGQVLKANMRAVGATEFAIILYRDKLPKFNNGGKMIYDWAIWRRDSGVPKIHPTQKPITVLKDLIETYTDPFDVVIDPVAGSGTTLRAAAECGRSSYGFEIEKEFYRLASEQMLANIQISLSFDTENIEEAPSINYDIFDFLGNENEVSAR
jgi:site-specific DNA-methyltransferase (adenine-specific)